MKRPSFQFYPADFSANSNLKRCSWAAKGAWIMLICLLHDSDQYGIIRWSLDEIAQAIGCPIELIQELVKKNVLKGVPKGGIGGGLSYTPRSGGKKGETVWLIEDQNGNGEDLWYSSRMVIDEYVRLRRAAYGELSQKSPNASKKKHQNNDQPKGGIGYPIDTPPTSTSTSTNINQSINHGFSPFCMFPEWQPSEQIEKIAAFKGLGITKNPEFIEKTGEFIAYWLTKKDQRTQAEWDHALIQNIKFSKSNVHKSKENNLSPQPEQKKRKYESGLL